MWRRRGGTPVVAAAVGGLRTLVDDGRTGVLLDGAMGLQLEDASVTGGYFGVYAKGHASDTKLAKLSVRNALSGVFLDGISPSSGNTYGVRGLLIAGDPTIIDSKLTGLHAQGDCAGTRVFAKTIQGGPEGVQLQAATGITVSLRLLQGARLMEA